MHRFSLCRRLIDELDLCGLLWCFYQLFGLSLWGYPFTAEDPLVSEFLQPDEETNSSTSWMAWGAVDFQQLVLYFWMNYSFNAWITAHILVTTRLYIILLYITNPGLSKSKWQFPAMFSVLINICASFIDYQI